ncbi:hypothetical protein GCM10007063_05730 [Lentibacillus kapialis]|uniref:Uncharacterized protein n=1 Tax=Lentibacillus kapialis TaxID=340214 RepID=A0A917UUB0_9BACI|nr:hypothetical protein [Lentibacillus kapialis]GGJ86074.1 hypothetical protein GCM10007063_05730 [Lentibacillus kapialis]
MIKKGEELYFSVDGGEPQKLEGIQELEIKQPEANDGTIDHLNKSYEATMMVTESNIREMTPRLRKYFKIIRMNGKMYL